MRKKDYEILAAAIAKHSREPFSISESEQFELGKKLGIKCVAYTFARFANVDKTEFLKACGIE